jgi:hypothetical protein
MIHIMGDKGRIDFLEKQYFDPPRLGTHAWGWSSSPGCALKVGIIHDGKFDGRSAWLASRHSGLPEKTVQLKATVVSQPAEGWDGVRRNGLMAVIQRITFQEGPSWHPNVGGKKRVLRLFALRLQAGQLSIWLKNVGGTLVGERTEQRWAKWSW